MEPKSGRKISPACASHSLSVFYSSSSRVQGSSLTVYTYVLRPVTQSLHLPSSSIRPRLFYFNRPHLLTSPLLDLNLTSSDPHPQSHSHPHHPTAGSPSLKRATQSKSAPALTPPRAGCNCAVLSCICSNGQRPVHLYSFASDKYLPLLRASYMHRTSCL